MLILEIAAGLFLGFLAVRFWEWVLVLIAFLTALAVLFGIGSALTYIEIPHTHLNALQGLGVILAPAIGLGLFGGAADLLDRLANAYPIRKDRQQ